MGAAASRGEQVSEVEGEGKIGGAGGFLNQWILILAHAGAKLRVPDLPCSVSGVSTRPHDVEILQIS